MKLEIEVVKRLASGRWAEVFSALAPELDHAVAARGRHVACPVHGGTDGFRFFKDWTRTGGAVCNQCGIKADGFALLSWLKGVSFKDALESVASELGITASSDPCKVVAFPDRQAQIEAERQKQREAVQARRMSGITRGIWKSGVSILSPEAAPVRKYLEHRGISPAVIRDISRSGSVKFCPELVYQSGTDRALHPGMICAIRGADGLGATLHRTYLQASGAKADVPEPKKTLPVLSGRKLTGGAIRLVRTTGSILGIAEGIETALSAYQASGIPVWAATNAYLLEHFEPPKGVSTVLIWGDRDVSETGQRAAYALKGRLAESGIMAYVVLPHREIQAGEKSVDWNDVLRDEGVSGFPDPLKLRRFLAERRA